MPGLSHSLRSVVDTLKGNLRDRYSDDDAVLKELLQNADDAGASRFHLGGLEGFPQAENQLLRGPLLFTANDAAFRPEDAYGIVEAAGGSKSEDAEKIGRYGLGLKSVYRLGEVFFFLSDRPQDDPEFVKTPCRTRDVINPWECEPQAIRDPKDREEAERRKPWSVFSEHDQHLLADHLEPVLGDAKRWFAVFVPLRDHRVPAEFAMHEWRTEKDPDSIPKLISREAVSLLTSCLPLLGTVKELHFWREVGGRLVSDRRVHVENGGQRLSRKTGDGLAGEAEIAGRITTDFDGEIVYHRFSGRARRCDVLILKGINLEDAAGQRLRTDARSGAVVIAEQPASTSAPAGVYLQWAVFLPLSAPLVPLGPSDTATHICITVHGTFYPDGGRQRVPLPPEDPAAEAASPLTTRWNGRILRKACLPNVIPALEAYLGRFKADERRDRARAVCDAIRHGLRGKLNGAVEAVTNGGGFVEVPDRRNAAVYQRIAAAATVVTLPPWREKLRVRRLLPHLFDASTGGAADGFGPDVAWVFDGPNLLPDADDPARGWTVERAVKFLGGCDPAVLLAEADGVAYVVEMVESIGSSVTNHPAVQAAAVAMARGLLRPEHATSLRRNHKAAAVRLLGLLDRARMLRVPRENPVEIYDGLVERLNGGAGGLLFVPADLAPADAAGRPDEAEARAMLKGVAGHAATDAGDGDDADKAAIAKFAVAASIVEAALPGDADASGLQRLLAGLPLLPLRLGGGKARAPQTIDTLLELGREQRVFQLFDQRYLKLALLEQALTVDVASLHSSDTTLAGWFRTLLERDVPRFSVAAVVASLKVNAGRLVAEAGPRERLFMALVKEDAAETVDGVAVLRRLLVRPASGMGSGGEAALFRSDGDATARRLLHALLGDDGRSSFVEVDAALLADLPTRVVTELNVRPTEVAPVAEWWRQRRGVGRRLDSATAERVRAAFVDDAAAARSVTIAWPKDDDPGLKALPLFLTVDGRTLDLGDTMYPTEGGMDLGDVVIPGLTLLRLPPGDRAYADRLHALGCQPLDPDAAMERGLAIANPESRERFLLRCLEKRDSQKPLPKQVLEQRWLRTASGEVVAPETMLRLKPEAKERLHPDVRSLFYLPHELACADDDGKPPECLVDILPKPEAGLQWLGRDLGELGHGVGASLRPSDDDKALDDQLNLWLRVFGIAPDAQPAAPLLASLPPKQRRVFARVLAGGTPDAERFAPMIEAIRDAYDDTDHKTDRPALVKMLADVFAEAVKSDTWRRETLPKVHLLTRAGTWAEAGLLTFAAPNVPPVSCVRDELAEVLRPELQQNAARGGGDPPKPHPDPWRGSQFAAAREAGRRKLETFCDRWIDAGLPEQLALLPFAVLGDNDGFADVYRSRIGADELDSIRRQVFRRWTLRVLGTTEEAMGSCHFIVGDTVTGKIEVRSLTGQLITIDAAEAPEVFLETPTARAYYQVEGGGNCQRIALRTVEPPANPDEVLEHGRTLWQRTLKELLHQCYGVHAELDEVIGRAGAPEQYSLDYARMQLQTQLSARLEQPLRLRMGGLLTGELRKLKSLKQQLNKASVDHDDVLHRQVQREVVEHEAAIIGLIEDGAEVQGQLLEALREKLVELSYDASSIPFELFQNADDAAGEAVELFGQSAANEVKIFHLEASDRGLFVVHHGRPINQFRDGHRDRKERGFENDLDNMLALSASDKRVGHGAGPTAQNQTGHFGLGFKSVLFLTDRPAFVSGRRLGVEVRGGVLPAALPDPVKAGLKRYSEKAAVGAPPWGATVLDLPRRTGGPEVQDVVDRFERSAALAVCFARRLRRITLHRAGRQNLSFDGEPRATLDAGAVRLEVHRWDSERSGQRRALLIARDAADPYRAVAVVVDAEGIVRDGLGELPRVWATCPTDETERPWFAINADFELNPGRTQLHERGQNGRLIAAMRPLLRAALNAVQRAAGAGEGEGEPDGVTQALAAMGVRPKAARMAAEQHRLIPAYPGENPPPVRRFVHELQVGDDGALPGYFRDGAPFATGLGDGWPTTTTLNDVEFKCAGLLGREEVRKAAARVLPLLKRPSHSVHHMIAEARSQDLKRLEIGRELELYNLAELLTSVLELEDHKLTETLAGMLEPVFSLPVLGDWKAREELDALRKTFNPATLTAADGAAVGADAVVVPWHDDESARVAEVLGPARTLAPGYRQVAPSLVRWLVARPTWDVEQLVKAFREALDVDRRAACLRYASNGEQKRSIHERLKTADGWWKKLKPDDPAARGLSDNDRFDLGRRLGIPGFLPAGEAATRPVSHSTSGGPSYAKRCAALDRFCAEHHAAMGGHYDHLLYAGPRPRVEEVEDDRLDHDIDARRPWMLLLLRGLLFRMGRTKDGQHSTFLNQAMRDGQRWLDVFAAPQPDQNFEPWFDLLKETIDNRSSYDDHYAHWLSNIINILQLSLYLPANVRVLKALPQQMQSRPQANPAMLIDVREDADYSGSDLDAPTLLRPLGRIGFGFVLRELFRCGVYDAAADHELRKHAFTNKGAIRDLVNKITGCQPDEDGGGLAIYRSLNAAHEEGWLADPFFGGLHDVPFHLLAGHGDYKQHQARILNAG